LCTIGAEALENVHKSHARSLEGVLSTFSGRPVAGDRALIMAIVNRTPDSFYDRGATFTDEAAKAAARRVIEEGADVVDVGGVKAGPGDSVGVDEEVARVVPFIEWLRDAYPDPDQCRHLAL
jgi:dihydropteroate synthase